MNPVAPTLVIPPRSFSAALDHLPTLAALAAAGTIVLGLPDGHEAALEPTLLRWRLQNARDQVALPLTMALEDSGRLASLGCGRAIVLEPAFFYDWRLARAGIPVRWGRSGLRSLWLNRKVAGGDPALLEALGVAAVDQRRLDIPQGWREVGRERLNKARIAPGAGKVVAIYAGQADGKAGKPWPAERFEALLRELRRRHPGWQILILATLEDLWSAVLLFEKTAKVHPVIGADLGLAAFCGVLTQVDLVIAGESWPLRLAAALGTPCLGLYEDETRAPRASEHRILEASPLSAITLETVLAAADL